MFHDKGVIPNQECVPVDQWWQSPKWLACHDHVWHADKICSKSISLWLVPVIMNPVLWQSNGLHFGYQGCIKTHKQPIWLMVVNEGVFLIKDTHFHESGDNWVFHKTDVSIWIPKWVHSSIQVPKVLWCDGHVSFGSKVRSTLFSTSFEVIKAMSLAISNQCYSIRSSFDLICDHQTEGFTDAWCNKGSSNSFLSQAYFCFHSAMLGAY